MCLFSQVKDGATEKELKDAYKHLSLLVHPDKCKADGAVLAFQRLVTAYNTLKVNAA